MFTKIRQEKPSVDFLYRLCFTKEIFCIYFINENLGYFQIKLINAIKYSSLEY